jgi:hypothetical protein
VPTDSGVYGHPASADALLNLEVLLPGDQPAARQFEIAVLAARLHYRSMWLQVDGELDEADLQRVDALTALSARPLVGVSFGSLPSPTFLSALPAGVLLELPPPGDGREVLLESVGGAIAWSKRVRVRGAVDDKAAGVVIAGADRASLLTAAAKAAQARRVPHWSVVAAVTVSIGRTASEAAARASRDPRLADERHPRYAGVFGTLDDAQEQVLALARAGADTLLATLPDDVDVADLLAQLRSAVAGPTPLLHRRRT